MSTAFILASNSTARADLLRVLDYNFTVVPANIVEPSPLPDETPKRYLTRLARLKAASVAAQRSRAMVLAADTALWFPTPKTKGSVLSFIGKPGNAAAAMLMLQELAGKEHIVGTGVCLIAPARARRKQRVFCAFAQARVRLRALTTNEIRAYLRRAKPWQCAGAYALQGAGSAIIAHIHGDPSVIIGLPLSAVSRLLHV